MATLGDLSGQGTVTIAKVHLASLHFTDTTSDYGWEAIGATNGDQDSPAGGPPPTSKWDGSSPCGQVIRVSGTGTSWVEYQLTGCDRVRTITDVPPDTLASGSHVSTHVRHANPYGGSLEGAVVHCGDQPCPDIWVDQETFTFDPTENAYRSFSYVVASSRSESLLSLSGPSPELRADLLAPARANDALPAEIAPARRTPDSPLPRTREQNITVRATHAATAGARP